MTSNLHSLISSVFCHLCCPSPHIKPEILNILEACILHFAKVPASEQFPGGGHGQDRQAVHQVNRHQLTLQASRSDFGVEVVSAWKSLPPRDYR